MNTTNPCGCCEGVTIAVPQNTTNRPGLSSLTYRVGTHGTFLETMIARLSSQDFPALAGLKTRDPADPSLALLDSWALVADVLTFYQERIANEGYLRTATERRSILELGRLIGYKLRPGVSASAFLAYTLEEDRSKNPPLPTRSTIPVSSLVQSVPGSGQLPQTFETSEELTARSEWNNLQPRLTQPQSITIEGNAATDATTRAVIYFKDTTIDLKTGDPLLFILGPKTEQNSNQQVMRFVRSVEPQEKRTRVILQNADDKNQLNESLNRESRLPNEIDFPGPLGGLKDSIQSLALPPSLQPRNSLLLTRSVDRAFSSKSDIAPRLIGAFVPAAAPMLYHALTHFKLRTTKSGTQVGAIKIKAGLFPGNYPGLPMSTRDSLEPTKFHTSFPAPPTIESAWPGLPTEESNENKHVPIIALDSVYDKIIVGSWVMIDRPNFPDPVIITARGLAELKPLGRTRTFHRVTGSTNTSMATVDSGFSAKVTQLTLDPPWLDDLRETPGKINMLVGQTGLLPGTIVYAQSEILELAEEPINDDIAGDTIELGEAYEGLESGRWIIVSGERTDIANVKGVTGSEAAMLLGVSQETNATKTRAGTVHSVLTLAKPLAYTYDRKTVTIYGNVVKSTQGETRREVLGSGDSSQALQEFALKQKPLTFIAASNPRGTDSTLKVYVNNLEWHETDTLAGLGPKDRNFITRTTDDDTTVVAFGNGREGARLPTSAGNLTAVYRNGIGQGGNVDAGQINLLQSRPANVKAVINPLRASGGADRDSRDQARRNAPLAVMALDRLVSVQDYADFSRTFAGIGKASSTRLTDGQRDLVHVTIAGAGDIPIDTTSDLFGNLVSALQINGDPYLPLQVAVRRLKVLVISVNVKILPDYLWESVANAVRAALLEAFGFDRRELGQTVFQSEVIGTLQAVEGVAYADLDILDSVAEDITAAELAKLATTLELKDFVEADLAEANATSKNSATNPILAAELVYLTPTIPDTLILNEVKP